MEQQSPLSPRPAGAMSPKRRPPVNPDRTPRRQRPPMSANGTPRRQRPPMHPGETPRRQHPQQRKKPVSKQKKAAFPFPIWIPILAIYTVILFIVSSNTVSRVHSYLSEVESSRPQYVIDTYLSKLDESFYDAMLEKAAQDIKVTSYERLSDVIAALPKDTDQHTYTCRAHEQTNGQAPVYDICSGGKAIAEMQLRQCGQTEHYEIPLWEVQEPVTRISVHAEPQYSVSVTMPANAVLKINGKEVPQSEMAEAEPDIQFDTFALKYGEQPKTVHCTVSGLYLLPKVTVTDTDGTELTPEETPSPTAATQKYVFHDPPLTNPDPALVNRVEALTRAYINYVSNNGRNGSANLSVLNQYLVNGSSASKMLASIMNDIKWNNQYVSRNDKVFEVSKITKYSDKLCVCEIKFDVVLTKIITNEYAGTIRWVMIHNGYNWFAESFTLWP